MATEHMDNFWAYGVNGFNLLLNGVYAETTGNLVADPDTSAGGDTVLALYPNNGQDVILRKVLSGPQGTVGLGGRFWLQNLPTATAQQPCFAKFRDANNVDLCLVTCNPSGYLQAWGINAAGNAWVLIGQSASPVIIANAWRFIESKVLFSNGAGTLEVRVEGSTALNIAGAVTAWNGGQCQNAGPGYQRSIGSVGPTLYVKDLIIWNGTGAVNSNFWGPCQVYTIDPDSDVAIAGWTLSSGAAGYSLINKEPPGDDGSYIAAPSPAPAAAKFGLSDLPANVTAVLSVIAMHRSRKSDSGDGSLQLGLISGASTGLGVNRPISTAYTYWADPYDQDPNGPINWSPAAVNALEMQINRTA